MSEHFIKDIEIKNFKCFKDFQAEGFGRVNLIGGKNNVGKTAFMEAVYLISGLQNIYQKLPEDLERERLYIEILKLLLSIEQNRKGIDFLVPWFLDTYELNHFENFTIELRGNIKLTAKDNSIMPERFQKRDYWNDGSFKLSEHRENQYFYEVRKNKQLAKLEDYRFISLCNATHTNIKKLLSQAKKQNKNDYINEKLQNMFDISKIDLTDDGIILFDKRDSIFKSLSEYGDGIKHFINIILTLLTHKNIVIFLDEIENGIHYTNLDKLWEIILTISKQQNVQVFATTHSKECIESYARVAKELEDNEITFFKLGHNKKGELKGMVYPYDWFVDSVEQEQELRGW